MEACAVIILDYKIKLGQYLFLLRFYFLVVPLGFESKFRVYLEIYLASLSRKFSQKLKRTWRFLINLNNFWIHVRDMFHAFPWINDSIKKHKSKI